jgi:urea transport system ATP-binding protein
VLDPTLLILDEPAEGIQPNIVEEIGQLIRRLCRELHLTVLLVEQKLRFVRHYADHFIILDKGRVVAGGELAQLSDELVAGHLVV